MTKNAPYGLHLESPKESQPDSIELLAIIFNKEVKAGFQRPGSQAAEELLRGEDQVAIWNFLMSYTAATYTAHPGTSLPPAFLDEFLQSQISIAQQNGQHWNLTLDAIVCSGMWRHKDALNGLLPLLGQLGGWITDQPSKNLAPLLRFRAICVRLALAKYATQFSEEIVDILATSLDALMAMAQNPSIPDKLANRLCLMVLEYPMNPGSTNSASMYRYPALLEFARRKKGLPQETVASLKLQLAQRAAKNSTTHIRGQDPIAALLHDQHTDSDTLSSFLDWTKAPKDRAAIFIHPHSTAKTKSRIIEEAIVGRSAWSDPVTEIAREVAVLPQSKEQDLLSIAMDPSFAVDHNWYIQASGHPSASNTFWRFAASNCSNPDLRVTLASLPNARQDDQVRKILLTSTAGGVIENLLSDATAAQFTILLEKLIARSPAQALDIMIAARPEQLTNMTRKDIAPFLNNPDRDLRAKAMQILPKISKLDPSPSEEIIEARKEATKSTRRLKSP